MTLAHVNKYYLETNLMAALPSSHLDSLYADLQVHALDVSDGLAKVQTTLGTDMLTTWTWASFCVGNSVHHRRFTGEQR